MAKSTPWKQTAEDTWERTVKHAGEPGRSRWRLVHGSNGVWRFVVGERKVGEHTGPRTEPPFAVVDAWTQNWENGKPPRAQPARDGTPQGPLFGTKRPTRLVDLQ